jgi:tryptophanyl-tRNA synthetase
MSYMEERYRAGRVGDVEVKRKLHAALEAFLAPIRERRAAFQAQPGLVDDILAAGAGRVRPISEDTVCRAREFMGLA